MSQNIITISREYGSGGRIIGKRVAEILGISFYDKELIRLAAKESDYSLEYIEEIEELAAGHLGDSLTDKGPFSRNIYDGGEMSAQDKLYLLQDSIIKEIAAKEACVIVGRCADYILRDRKDCVHIFIHAAKEYKMERIVNVYGLDPASADQEIRRRDKKRAIHYQLYTDQVWGAARNYHMTLDSGFFGSLRCAEIISEIAKK